LKEPFSHQQDGQESILTVTDTTGYKKVLAHKHSLTKELIMLKADLGLALLLQMALPLIQTTG
jgi:hypothetical protein